MTGSAPGCSTTNLEKKNPILEVVFSSELSILNWTFHIILNWDLLRHLELEFSQELSSWNWIHVFYLELGFSELSSWNWVHVFYLELEFSQELSSWNWVHVFYLELGFSWNYLEIVHSILSWDLIWSLSSIHWRTTHLLNCYLIIWTSKLFK